MNSCVDILKEMKATPEEIKWMQQQMKSGTGDDDLANRLIEEIKLNRFRKANNDLSEKNTRQFLDKLKNVSTKIKKPYNAIF